jgi:DNA-binding protein HU-beta
MARNPATGAAIKVPKSSVPRFRAGADFKAMVNGQKKATAKK